MVPGLQMPLRHHHSFLTQTNKRVFPLTTLSPPWLLAVWLWMELSVFISTALFWKEQQNSFHDCAETLILSDLAVQFTGASCPVRSLRTRPRSHADLRCYPQWALYESVDCHKNYKNEFDFSRYTLLTSKERRYQKEITNMLLIQMLL